MTTRGWYRDFRLGAALVVAVLAIWAFATLPQEVWEPELLARWDAAAAAWVHGHATPAGTRFFGGLTKLGASNFTMMIALAIAPVLWRHPVLLVGWIATFAGGVRLEKLLKALIQRPRPPSASTVLHQTSYSFPSGHAMAAMIGYAMLAYLIVRLTGWRDWRRTMVYAAAAALILGIGLSRVYIGVHYPSDILGAYVIGAAWVALCLTIIHRLERRVQIHF